MTTVELMDNLAEFLRPAVADYSARQPSGQRKIKVYAGFPPARFNADEQPSYIYALVTGAQDTNDMAMSTATVEIGFNIYDNSDVEDWRSLYNLMEHVRQYLLRHRLVAHRHRLQLPLKLEVPEGQPAPQWQGKLTVIYTIGQPEEEDINYDDIQETSISKY